ncbi:MAG: alpha/beta hydrolase [Chloroflexota bacterium]
MGDSKQITLSDGRKLGYVTLGPETGRPIFYHHGWPSSRFEALMLQDVMERVNGRLIAVDRPGYGLSDFQPDRTLLDWPDDISELADQLGIDQFYVMGLSGGGPYVAACAYKIPHRLLGATIVAGLSPMSNPQTQEGMRQMNRILLSVGKSMPWLLNLLLWPVQSASSNPKMLERMLSDLPDVDKAVLTEEAGTRMLHSAQESFRQGRKGATQGGRIYAQPWGFELSHITMPVSIWQGTLDVNVPQSNGRIFANNIPNATAHFIEGEGHISLIANHGEAILADLLSSPTE